MRYQKRLTSDLNDCAAAGVISAEQAEKIRQWLAGRCTGSRIKAVTWIAMMAGLFVAMGLILIVSHNWDDIPAFVKVSGFVVILAAAGEASLRTSGINRPVYLPIEIFWFMLPIIGIGLYAQVFQLSGDPIRPYLLWMLLTLPLAYLSPYPVSPGLHVLALGVILFMGNFTPANQISLVARAKESVPYPVFSWVITAGMMGLAAYESRRRLGKTLQVYILGALLFWVIMLLIAHTPFHTGNEGLLMMAFMSASIIWIFGMTLGIKCEKGVNLPWIAWMAVLYSMSFLHNASRGFSGEPGSAGAAVASALAVAALALVIMSSTNIFSFQSRWNLLAKIMLAVSLALSAMTLSDSAAVLKAVGVTANLFMLAAATGIVWHGVRSGSVNQINFGLAVVVLVSITRFIDYFGSMLQSGFAFIVAGILLAGLAYAIHRSRKLMIDMAEARQLP